MSSFVMSVFEIQTLALAKCTTKSCMGCGTCIVKKKAITEACLVLDQMPFNTDPPPLYRYFYPYHTGSISIVAILVGYIYVLRHAQLVMEYRDHIDQKKIADQLIAENKERLAQWGQESKKSVLALCIFYELRILFAMAVFSAINRKSEKNFETVFRALLESNLLSKTLRVGSENSTENDEYIGFYMNIKKIQQ